MTLEEVDQILWTASIKVYLVALKDRNSYCIYYHPIGYQGRILSLGRWAKVLGLIWSLYQMT